MEWPTLFILLWSLFYLHIAKAAFLKIAVLLYQRKLRLSMIISFAFTLQPHFYCFWATWNFVNDRFYVMWYTQVRLQLSPAASETEPFT